ncbi:MAG: hypothetical protein IJG65_04910 [Synergistaceae bacterium]|nr:hypothetical protein [Synergistaceae bacterium]
MSNETIERGNTVLDAPAANEDEYYEEDEALYSSPKFRAIMDEVLAEYEDMRAHPEKYKVYTSTKEMFRDMGFDVSNFPDR